MNMMKFDEEKVKNHIDVFYDNFKRYPYLICSEETYKAIPWDVSSVISSVQAMTNYFQISNHNDSNEKNEKEEKKNYGTWHNAKILIDNELKFGEIYFG